METYNGKAKCGFGCGRRARFRAQQPNGQSVYACNEHAKRIEHLGSPKEDHGRMTEADYQTWGRL